MANLDQGKFQDINAYHFLVIWELISEPISIAGDQAVSSLGYWNDADLGSSQKTGASEANNLLLYCLTYGSIQGTTWIEADETKRLSGISSLSKLMSTATCVVSNISAQLGKIFSFTSSAIPGPYASLFAEAAATSKARVSVVRLKRGPLHHARPQLWGSHRLSATDEIA